MPQNNSGAKLPVNRTMPHSQEAEDAVIGAFLTDGRLFAELGAKLKDTDFYSQSNRLIFGAIKNLAMRGLPADIITLTNELRSRTDRDGTTDLDRAGGLDRLEELTEAIPSAANCAYYIDIVKRDALMRRIIEVGMTIVDNAYTLDDAEKCLALAEAEVYALGSETQSADLVPLGEPVLKVVEKFVEVYQTKKPAKGLLSYYKNLDNITNGFLPGQMLVLAARPGCGKTAFAMSIATNISKYAPDKVIATFNLEMSATELAQRMVVSASGIPSDVLSKGDESQEELTRLFEAQTSLSNSKIYIDQSTENTAEVIMSKCRRLKNREKRLDLVIIDYLQLMEPTKSRNGNRQQEVSDTSRMIKIMAKELEVPVLLLSQMSRDIEKREIKTPMLSDLRESGAIEQDADMVMFLNDANSDDAEGDEKAIELIIAKHRNGATGSIFYVFDKRRMRFRAAAGKYLAKKKENEGEPEKVGEIMERGDVYDDYEAEYSDNEVPPEDNDKYDAGYGTPSEERNDPANDGFDLSELQDTDIPDFPTGGGEEM